MKNITISDITLRECEQEYASKLSFKEKQEIAKLLEKINVDIIETGYISGEQADTVFIRMLAGALEQSTLCVPVTASRESIEKAWEALSKAKKPRLNLIMPTSTVGMEFGMQIKPDAMPTLVGEMVTYAKTLCNDIEFTADDAVRSEFDFLAKVLGAAINAGAGTVTLVDSDGELLPDEIEMYIRSVLDSTPELENVTLGFHIKDKLGVASACALSSIDTGVSLVKVSTGSGSGTLSLEALLNIIKLRGETIGISSNLCTTSYQRICARLAVMTGDVSPVRKGSGQQATAEQSADTGAGSTKADAVLPENADISQLRSYIQTIGYDVSEDDLNRVFTQYQDIARSKNVVADDIEALIAENAGQAPPIYQLKNYVINSGSAITATAYIEFEKDGDVKAALSTGDGPIDAAFKAAENIFGTHYELEDFRINAVTSGREATGDALIKLRSGGKLYSGRGVSTDIVGASIRAYLSAVNKILSEV